MIVYRPEIASAERAQLGEGPIWDAESQRLYWIDIFGRRIHIADSDGATILTHDIDMMPGTVVPAGNGGLLLATDRGIELQDPSGRIDLVDDFLASDPDRRFNDGKADPSGRVFVGTVSMSGAVEQCALYRLDDAGHPHRVLDGVSLSNGLGWSPDGTRMYYVDTPTGRIDAFTYDIGTGELRTRRTFATLPDGLPDGLCVDAQGGVWVAVYGGGRVVRFDPDGRMDAAVEFDIPNITSCAFGGSDLSTLFVTTARVDMTEEELDGNPHAGALFRADTGRKGIAAPRWPGHVW